MRFQVGDTQNQSKTITDADVRTFAALVGDNNPLHLDEGFAQRTRFGKRIAHGMIGASLISTVLGVHLPGPGTIYLSQTLQFKGPVYIGDTITARVTVTKIHETKPVITLETTCMNQRSEEVMRGEAVVLYEPVGAPARSAATVRVDIRKH